MRIARHLWRRGLTRFRLACLYSSSRDDALLAFADEFEANDRALRELLAHDGGDTEDVPGFNELADRQAELVDLIVASPAQSLAGAVAKARCARLCPPEQGFDAALALALSASDDMLCLVDGTVEKPRPVDLIGGDRHLAVLRRNGLWRQLIDVLIQVGVWSFVGAVLLPLDGVYLTWTVIIALFAVGIGATCLGFFCLRFIDHSG